MQCPVCKLYNPENAMRCDCGYDFDSGTMKGSFAPDVSRAPSAALVAFGWLFSVLGGWLGILLACIIAFSKTSGQYQYDEKSRRTGKKMLVFAIVMTVVGLFLQFAAAGLFS